MINREPTKTLKKERIQDIIASYQYNALCRLGWEVNLSWSVSFNRLAT